MKLFPEMAAHLFRPATAPVRLRLSRHWGWIAAGIILAASVLAAFVVAGPIAGKAGYSEANVSHIQPLKVGNTPGLAITPVPDQPGNASLPWIVVSPAYYDFGEVDARTKVTHQFVITNKGAGPLVVEQAYTTCTCTTAELTAAIIPPGKVSLVTVRFDPAFHRTGTATVRRGLILQTNDPIHPQAEIWIQAHIK
jgi:hypothetical protein